MKIRITGGYSEYVVGDLTDTNGEDLALATIKVALIPIGSEPGTKVSPDWKTPDVLTYPAIGHARVSLLVEEGDYPVGTYMYWVLPIDSPTAVPVMARNDKITLT